MLTLATCLASPGQGAALPPVAFAGRIVTPAA
jgi:hypothetical protein